MGKKACLAALAGIALAFSIAVSGPAQVEAWKGTVKIEDGIRVIRNPAEPLNGDIVLDLAEDLTIGSEDDGNAYFYKEIELAVDREGAIYVLDPAESRAKQGED